MSQTNKLSHLQSLGLIISILGLFFVAFPNLIGVFAVRIITFIFLMIGFSSLTFSIFVKSKISTFVSLIVLVVGVYAFINPKYVLLLVGFACVISGLNGIFLTLSKLKTSTERSLITSILLILIGVFAILNTKAALSTIVLILGIMIVILGVIVFSIGAALKKSAKTFDSTDFTQVYRMRNLNRVVVKVDEDDIEEVEFKDL